MLAHLSLGVSLHEITAVERTSTPVLLLELCERYAEILFGIGWKS